MKTTKNYYWISLLLLLVVSCEKANYMNNVKGLWELEELYCDGLVSQNKNGMIVKKLLMQFEPDGSLIIYNDSTYEIGKWQLIGDNYLKFSANHKNWLISDWAITSTEVHGGILILKGKQNPNRTTRLTFKRRVQENNLKAEIALKMDGKWKLYKMRNARQTRFSDSLWIEFNDEGSYITGVYTDTLNKGSISFNDWFQTVHLENNQSSIGFKVKFIGEKLKLSSQVNNMNLYFIKSN